jgi:hypothetical protein
MVDDSFMIEMAEGRSLSNGSYSADDRCTKHFLIDGEKIWVMEVMTDDDGGSGVIFLTSR